MGDRGLVVLLAEAVPSGPQKEVYRGNRCAARSSPSCKHSALQLSSGYAVLAWHTGRRAVFVNLEGMFSRTEREEASAALRLPANRNDLGRHLIGH